MSSPLLLRGDNEYTNQKIFRIDPAGIHVVEQFQRDPSPGFLYAPNFYNAIDPDVSGDGRVFSFVAQRTCTGGSSCVYVELYQSHITGAGAEVAHSGRTRLSRNGRYALRYGSTALPSSSDPVPALIDLVNGTRTAVPGHEPEGRQVASDGTVVTLMNESLVLWKAGATRTLTLGSVYRAVLSDNGAAVVAELGLNGGPEKLVLYDVASGSQTVIVPQSPTGFHASISDDGRWLSYVFGGKTYLYDHTAGRSAKLNDAAEGVQEAVISGDGSTVWEATAWGRILRVDAASGSVREVVPRTPIITSIQGAPVPGSLNWLFGSGLAGTSASAAAPLPELLGGQGVLLNSTRARMLSVSPGVLVYQIPFDILEGIAAVGFSSNDSPFDSPPWQVQLQTFLPEAINFDTLDGACCDPVIAHADFSALVSQSNPALPGELVHGYFTGLGQVSPPLESGAAAPLDRPSQVEQNPSCTYYQSPAVAAPAEVLFAGMAPGMIGIYQVDFRLPQSVSGLSNNPSQTLVLYMCDSWAFDVWINFGQ